MYKYILDIKIYIVRKAIIEMMHLKVLDSQNFRLFFWNFFQNKIRQIHYLSNDKTNFQCFSNDRAIAIWKIQIQSRFNFSLTRLNQINDERLISAWSPFTGICQLFWLFLLVHRVIYTIENSIVLGGPWFKCLVWLNGRTLNLNESTNAFSKDIRDSGTHWGPYFEETPDIECHPYINPFPGRDLTWDRPKNIR